MQYYYCILTPNEPGAEAAINDMMLRLMTGWELFSENSTSDSVIYLLRYQEKPKKAHRRLIEQKLGWIKEL